MTRADALKAMEDGNVVVDRGGTRWMFHALLPGYFINGEWMRDTVNFWFTDFSHIEQPKKTRPMTRLEVLEKVVGRGGLVARKQESKGWIPASSLRYDNPIERYAFAYITDGEIHGMHKAEVEE